MNLTEYRNSKQELEREASIIKLMPANGRLALDVGARDGHFSKILARKFETVWAVDLQLPQISVPNVNCLAADATNLPFSDGYFDLVLCSEVLEHIPKPGLEAACEELQRVCGGVLVIGVPFRQDLRIGRATCQSCLRATPAWGHVNSFTHESLVSLFPSMVAVSTHLVGENLERTNFLSTWLLDFSGNPFGVRNQEEVCIHCGKPVGDPPERSVMQRVFTRIATLLNKWQSAISSKRANWIHIKLERRNDRLTI